MNQFTNPFLNPYGMQQQPVYQMNYQQPVPQMQVTRVNGENGARSFQMGANSSALLLDETGTLVWLCTTDGAGYKSVSAYDITPHQDVPKADYGSLESRIQRLEEIVNGNTADTSAVRKKPVKSDSVAD